MLGIRLATRGLTMDSATPLEPAPAAPPMLAAVEPELLELVDKWYENLQKAPLPEEVFHWLGKPNCPVSQGGGDTYPLFPGENRDSVAVATLGPWSSEARQNIVGFASANRLFDCRSTQSITGLLKQNLPLGSLGWRQDPHIFRERTRRRRHPPNGWCRARQLR